MKLLIVYNSSPLQDENKKVKSKFLKGEFTVALVSSNSIVALEGFVLVF
jgi:hypothetical protein